jgi:hypothetical protein
MLFPMVTDDWLNLALYYSTYHNSRQNVIFRSKAWINVCWEYRNGKLFAYNAFLFSVYPSFVFIERLKIHHV